MPITDFKTDPEAAKHGVWREYSPNSDGTVPAVLIARSSRQNPAYTKKMRDLVVKPDGTVDATALSGLGDEESTEMEVDLFCETIILDWRHIQPNDGGVDDEVPFSTDNAGALLKDPAYFDFFDDIRTFAGDISHYRDQQLEDASKN